MIVKPIDLAMVQRMNDVSQVKQNENMRPGVEQQNISSRVQKEVYTKSEQVTKKENPDQDTRGFNAKEKSDNEYYGEEQGDRKKRSKDGRVFLKGQKNVDFDVKI